MKYLFFGLLELSSFSLIAQEQFYKGDCTQDKKFCVYFAPSDMPVSAVAGLLRQAKSSIKILTYNMNVDSFGDILKSKLKQNVSIEFLVDYKLSFESNKVWRSMGKHPKLLRYKVPVLRGGNPQMHNKVIIIDDKIAVTGSANFTYSGLAANYENIMVVNESSMVKSFIDEFNELKQFSRITCESLGIGECGSGEEKYSEDLHLLMTTGAFPANALVTTAGICQGLVSKRGLLNFGNRPFNSQLFSCFKETEKYQRFMSLVALNERKSQSKKEDKYQVYFSPEDGLEEIILRELNGTLKNPASSFVYISVNFITNRKLAAALVEMKRKGVRMKVFFDRGRFDDPNFKQSLEILNELGFTSDDRDENKLITIFDNRLTGSYGSNHNKLAVIGNGEELVVLNGSANWSMGAHD